jgi:hypothetical protein
MNLSSMVRPALFLGASNLILLACLQQRLTLDWALILAMVTLLATALVIRRPDETQGLPFRALLGLCALMAWPFLGMATLVAYMEPAKLETVWLLAALASLAPWKTLALGLVLGWSQAQGLSAMVGWSVRSAVGPSARATTSHG